ncbi:hypothetical protein J6590_046461 [Homalodisca vitripennis]|nr:hypothetical protein J6590_046461 [Homalodisca vitripennis]
MQGLLDVLKSTSKYGLLRHVDLERRSRLAARPPLTCTFTWMPSVVGSGRTCSASLISIFRIIRNIHRYKALVEAPKALILQSVLGISHT